MRLSIGAKTVRCFEVGSGHALQSLHVRFDSAGSVESITTITTDNVAWYVFADGREIGNMPVGVYELKDL